MGALTRIAKYYLIKGISYAKKGLFFKQNNKCDKSYRILILSSTINTLAHPQRFELWITVLETVVLPLHQGCIYNSTRMS